MLRSRLFAMLAGAIVVGFLLAPFAWWFVRPQMPSAWQPTELDLLRSLWIGSLPPPPADSSNALADNPQAAKLGQQLFFDPRLSANGAVSCSTCHLPELSFTDGKTVSLGIGISERHSMSLIGVAYSPWLFWDGRKDSLWSQALAPLESPVEHGASRQQVAELIVADGYYRDEYEALFESLPNDFSVDAESSTGETDRVATKIFVNVGKAIAAYERMLLPGETRFDTYVKGILENDKAVSMSSLSVDEIAGLRLFIGKAQCINCHNGPLFTNNEFHNTAVLPAPGKLPSLGRVSAVREARADPFNCLGEFSDDPLQYCAELRFTRSDDELIGAHKTPSLRNVAVTGPYMHAGQMTSLTEIIDQYNRAPLALIGHNDADPLGLSKKERDQLESFLHSLTGPMSTSAEWLSRPEIRSSIPSEDPIER